MPHELNNEVNSMNTATILETIMILCFGISWPLSIARMYKSWSTGGKSIFFSCFILLGYICGICGKILAHNYNLAFIFYIINTVMVTVDILLWIRNYRYEKTGKKTFFI